MSEQRVFHAPNLDMGRLVQALLDWYGAEKFEVQALDLPQGGVVSQARQEETWRQLLGGSSALNVALRREGDKLIVEVGAGKWVDKAVAAGAGLLAASLHRRLWRLAAEPAAQAHLRVHPALHRHRCGYAGGCGRLVRPALSRGQAICQRSRGDGFSDLHPIRRSVHAPLGRRLSVLALLWGGASLRSPVLSCLRGEARRISAERG
ncbi:MAG TPA: hypothetical protein VNK89_02040 [Thermoflexus sp.]|nr:hypothetical protein [Thermoflexus sp.]